MTEFKIENNAQYNSTEVFFESKPTREIIDSLKASKFRWNPRKGCWYGFLTADEVKVILSGKAPEKPPRKQPNRRKINTVLRLAITSPLLGDTTKQT